MCEPMRLLGYAALNRNMPGVIASDMGELGIAA